MDNFGMELRGDYVPKLANKIRESYKKKKSVPGKKTHLKKYKKSIEK